MLDNTQKEQLEGMMKRPIPTKKIGIIRLRMVKESSLYGMKRFSQPWEAVELVRPLFDMADREMVVVMCFHNHPSGDPEPSQEDKLLAKRIEDSGRLLGIPLIDHIIVGESGFYSFRQNGLIYSTEPDNAA